MTVHQSVFVKLTELGMPSLSPGGTIRVDPGDVHAILPPAPGSADIGCRVMVSSFFLDVMETAEEVDALITEAYWTQ